MKVLLKILAGVIGLFVLVMVVQMLASESGEVVVLTTSDGAGARQETRLWVVDHDGSAWLRAGADSAGWFVRLNADPKVQVERGGSVSPYHATPVPDATAQINQLMAQKYGWADRYVGVMFSREHAVAIRLDPVLD